MHFTEVNTNSFYDTTNEDFRLLQAVYKNDTTAFRQYQKDKLDERIKRELIEEYTGKFDSVIIPRPLYETGADEAYRFAFTEAFCHEQIVITISKSLDSMHLQMLLYHDKHTAGVMGADLINSFTKTVDSAIWEQLEEAINYCDFWSLKPNNNIVGFDGSSLTIKGYMKKYYQPGSQFLGPKSHIVCRWSPEETALFKPFRIVLKFSGLKQICGIKI